MAKTVEKQIVDHLTTNGQKMSWLAEKIGVSQSHLHLVLKGKKSNKRALTEDSIRKINEVLGTSFDI